MKKIVCVEAPPFSAFNPAQMDRLLGCKNLAVHDCRGKSADNPELLKVLQQAEIVISGNELQFTNTIFNSLPNLKLIAKFGVGLDMIDIPSATAHQVLVCNTPGANNVAVAEHTFALLLGYLRQVIRCDTGMRQGKWEQTQILGGELAGKTYGLVGLGAIGRCLVPIAKGFGMQVIAYDPYWPSQFAQDHRIEQKTLHDLLRESDFVGIHCPLTQETSHSIGSYELSLMKPDAILLNMARGGIVHEQALYEALHERRIAGAILDAFSQEPPHSLPFIHQDNVLLSPHVGAFTKEAMEKMSSGVVEQVFEFLQGKQPQHLCNPECLPKK